MKQIENQKIDSRSITLFLKRESNFSDEDTIKLVKGISDKKTFTLNGKVVNQREITFDQLMKTETTGVSGWHRFEDAFARKFSKVQFTGEGDITQAMGEAFKQGQNEFESVFGDIRSVRVGDVFEVQEWPVGGGESLSLRFFVITSAGFVEFERATGVLL